MYLGCSPAALLSPWPSPQEAIRGRMSSKRGNLTPDELRNFQKCRKVANVSNDAVRKIWNTASELRAGVGVLEQRRASREIVAALAPFLGAYDLQLLPGVHEEQVEIRMADIAKVLALAAVSSSFWASALESAREVGMGQLSPILYHDEIVTGNILAPLKRKKLLCGYVSFREIRESLHKEQAWLPVFLLQRDLMDAVDGGLSAICAAFAKKLHAPQMQRDGVLVPLPQGATWFRIGPFTRLLSDMDAQRATFSSKGSAGIVPCIYCSNCLAADHWEAVPGAIGIHEHDASKFCLRADQDLFQALELMRTIRTKKDLAYREKAIGFNFHARGLLFDRLARGLLPPSKSSVDTLHCYFAQGCASWEVAYLVRHLRGLGVSLEELRHATLRAEWRLAHEARSPAASTLQALLTEKMLKDEIEGHYRGQAHQTRKMVFLL